MNLAVGKSQNENDLSHHHAFALFQLYAVIINIPICIFWAGGLERVSAIIAETSPLSIFLVAIFSIIWGLGTLLFGIACKVAGVGFGTNLTMGIVAIIGAFLPLITEKTLFSPFGAIICIGLIICCIGLWLATKALEQRDSDETLASAQTETKEDGVDESQFPICLESEKEMQELGDKNGQCNDSNSVKKNDKKVSTEEKEYSTLQKVLVCFAAGITAVQLQFAFIFGSSITDLAGGKVDDVDLPGKTPIGGSSAIIWLFAISLGAPPSIVNALWFSPVPLSRSIRAPWWRHFRLIATTSLPWISHIHIYGLSATILFPKSVAASISWPLLMMITNLWALLLSHFLGEWKLASQKTMKTFVYSVSVTMLGLLVLMCSVIVPTST